MLHKRAAVKSDELTTSTANTSTMQVPHAQKPTLFTRSRAVSCHADTQVLQDCRAHLLLAWLLRDSPNGPCGSTGGHSP